MQTHPLYLNGRWVDAGPPVEVIDPATGEPFARVATLDRPAVRQALEDAQRAWFEWRRLTAKERGRYLHRIADELERHAQEIARTITRENGKPLAQSRGEVAMAVDHLHWFAEEARRAYGRVVPHQAPGKRHLVIKSPIGVVGAISPWNFPLVLAVRKAAPALAAGCPVLLKPASATPLSAIALAKAAEAADLPAGVFQVVLGPARELAAELLENPICRKISFTGSTAVGKELIRGAAATITPLSLELGGHAAVLVFEDADLEAAVEGTLIAKFRNSGQSCIAANRILVHQSIHDRFVERLVERVRELKVGPGLEDGVEVGPLIDEAGLAAALRHVEDAVERGASLLAGGRRTGDRGFFLEPTVLAQVPAEALCMREETFAPVAPLTAFQSEEEAVAQANASEYGLAAYVFTRDAGRLWRLAETLEAGTIGVNDPVPSTSNCPFGGLKQSGWGRELGSEGLDAFLETKHVSFGGVDA